MRTCTQTGTSLPRVGAYDIVDCGKGVRTQ